MKSGANFIEQNLIAKLVKDGATAHEISAGMGINLAHIQTYFPKKRKKKAVKSDDPV